MHPWIRRILVGITALVLIAAVAVAAIWLRAEQLLARRHEVPARTLAIPSDPASLAQGRYLFGSLGCGGCHGPDGAGKLLWEGGANRLVASHIAPGRGSRTQTYTGADWDRAVRHGVRPDGRGLLAMPSIDFSRLTDADLGALVGYIQSLPPVDRDPGEHRLGLPLKAAIGLGRMPLAPQRIDHSLPPAPAVAVAVSVDHGRYVAQTCVGCHGPDLAGGPIPGMPPGTPPAARLRPGPGSALAKYADAAAFRAMFSSGKRPDGSAIAVMPFPTLAQLNETDTAALYLYLRSLPNPSPR